MGQKTFSGVVRLEIPVAVEAESKEEAEFLAELRLNCNDYPVGVVIEAELEENNE